MYGADFLTWHLCILYNCSVAVSHAADTVHFSQMGKKRKRQQECVWTKSHQARLSSCCNYVLEDNAVDLNQVLIDGSG